jgi:hypothetical protein
LVPRVPKVSDARADEKPLKIKHINVKVKSVEADKSTGTASFWSRKISWIIVFWLVYILGILGIGY